MKKLFFAVLLICLAQVLPAQDVLLDTMSKELTRNFNVLKKQNPPIYYLSYYVLDSTSFVALASMGDIVYSNNTRERELNVDVRSGSRSLDNTREFKGSNEDNISLDTFSIPVEDNAQALKNVLWRATEQEAKKAQNQFLKVKTDAAVRAQKDDTSADFSAPLKPQTYYAPVTAPEIDQEKIKKMIASLSSIMTTDDVLIGSDITFAANTSNRYIVTSEGSKIVEGKTLIILRVSLFTRNEDGMTIEGDYSYTGFTLSDLPSEEEMAQDIKKAVLSVRALVNSPALEPFSGPVILRNEAAGVFFHEILGHRVEGHRQKSDMFGQTFTKQVGKQIVSPIISVYDNPTLTHFNGVPLKGAYVYDDDGVKAQNVTIVKDGVLENFLMGRSPINNFANSNGHGRKDVGARTISRMGNTIVEVKNPVPFDELKKMLKEEIKKQGKPFGLLIEDISGGFTTVQRAGPQAFTVNPLLVYRVYPDERPDEIVRGLNIVGTPLASFNKIVAGADDAFVFNGNCYAESGWVPVSAISPSILITELEMEKKQKTPYKRPVIPAPFAQSGQTKGGK